LFVNSEKLTLKTIHALFLSAFLLSSLSGESINPSNVFGYPEDSVLITQIIDSYILACGGDAIENIQSESITGTLVRGQTGQVPLEIKSGASGQWYYAQTFAWGDQVIYGSDGETGWVQDTRNISVMSPEESIYFTLIMDPHAPVRIREIFPEMKVQGSEKIGDSEASIILAKSHEGISVELSIDKETGLLLRAGDLYFEDYRKAGQVTRPFRILLGKKQSEDDPGMIMRFTEISHNINIDDSIFELPQCVLRIKESPIHRTWIEVEADTSAMEACVGSYRVSPAFTITFTREKDHLFFYSPGALIKYEVKPSSSTDYFLRFGNLSFHFVKNESGDVTHVEFGRDRLTQAQKID
jgi:hypothetical protein